ncbi:MAG: hypothetical protein ACLUTZ_03185 [Oliverpabstia sp.]
MMKYDRSLENLSISVPMTATIVCALVLPIPVTSWIACDRLFFFWFHKVINLIFQIVDMNIEFIQMRTAALSSFDVCNGLMTPFKSSIICSFAGFEIVGNEFSVYTFHHTLLRRMTFSGEKVFQNVPAHSSQLMSDHSTGQL